MRPAKISTFCLVPLVLFACAHGRSDQPPCGRGVIVTLTRVTVTPTPENNPGALWDQGADDSQNDDGCGLLVALDLVAAGVGSALSAVCSFSMSDGDGEQRKLEDPDLFVAFEVGSTTYTSPVIRDRASHDISYSLFVPRDALRKTGLRLAVYDLDGDDIRQTTLVAEHEFGRGALDRRIELRGEDLNEPSLKVLRLEVAKAKPTPSLTRTIAADDGLAKIDEIDIPAGMLVEIRATGSYHIGSFNDATLGPSGYPNGGPKDYNLSGAVFGKARHGAAIALLQQDSAAQAVVVGECTRFIAESGGTLFVGVNDTDYRNNSGELTFEIQVTAPHLDAWAQGGVEACD